MKSRLLTLAAVLAAIMAALAGVPASAQAYFFGRALPVDDPDKLASAELNADANPKTGRICYYLDVAGLSEVTAAHIHKGEGDEAGASAGDAAAASAGDAAGVSAGDAAGASAGDAAGASAIVLPYSPEGDERCVTVAPALVTAIMRDPGGYTFDVHTAKLPQGAVRGPLRTD